MSFVSTSIAIGGSAALGAGASIYSGMQQADAARGAAGAMSDAYGLANQTTIAAGRDALAYLDPFRAAGLRAGTAIESALYSPAQRRQQFAEQRIQLQGEVDRLKALAPKWETYQVLTGKNASERRASMFTQESQMAQQKIAEAEAKLQTFEQQVQAFQSQEGQQGPEMQESPWYQFQADLLNRSQDRAFAARGLTGSGFEAEERRRGLIELGAGETERQFSRMASLYGTGANAAAAGAGAITGTAQSLATQQIGAGQAQAQGLIGVAGANADMANGIGSSINSAVGTGLNYLQMQRLIETNRPTMSYSSTPIPDRDWLQTPPR